MTVWRTESEEETRELGRVVAESFGETTTCLLQGTMGCGKTVFAQGLGVGLGVDRRLIQSPTFTLVHEHEAAEGLLFHIDLYRLAEEDFARLGLAEILEGPGIKVVEWPERLPEEYRVGRCFLFEVLANDARRIREQRSLSTNRRDQA